MKQNEINKMYALEEAFNDLEIGELTAREYENVVARIEEDHEDD